MTFRTLGLVPVLALLAVGAAQAQTRGPSDVGNMAYPTPLPQGNVSTTTSQGPRDTGNMALPAGTSGPATAVPFHRRPRPTPAATPAAMSAPVQAPSADGMAAAKALGDAPGSAAVPYVDFAQPAPAMKGKGMMRAKKPMAKKVAMKKKPAATPAATPAPAAAAPTAPAPAK